MTDVREVDLTVDGRNLHLYEWLPDEPAHRGIVVYLHGMGDSGACMGDLGETLARHGFRAIFPDAPGHGGTELGEVWTEFSRADSARAVIEQYVGGPVVLGGHSMGAETAAIVASQRPDLVLAVLLEDPSMWFENGTEQERAEGKQRIHDWIEGLQSSTHEDRIEWVRNDGSHWQEVEYVPWANSKAAMDMRLFDVEYSWLGSGWFDVAPKLTMPTMLLRGDPNGHAMNPEVAARFCELVPHTVDVIAPTGHCVRRDMPIAFGAIMLGLLTPFA